MSYVHLARANYENVQNTKFVRKFVHIFAKACCETSFEFSLCRTSLIGCRRVKLIDVA